MKVWITKYALTVGIFEEEVEYTASAGMVSAYGGAHEIYYHKPDWHESYLKAKDRAEEMREKKIASLKKQIRKLGALRFGA